MTKSSARGLSPDLENFVMTKFLAPMPTDAELVFLIQNAAAAKPPFSTTPAGRRGRRADCKWMARTANSGTPPEGSEPMPPSFWMSLAMTLNFFVMTKKRGGVWASAG